MNHARSAAGCGASPCAWARLAGMAGALLAAMPAAHAISQGEASKLCKAEVSKQPGLHRHVFGKVRVGPERKGHRRVTGMVALKADRREFRCSVSDAGAVSNVAVTPLAPMKP